MDYSKPSRTVLLVTYHFPPSAASGSFRLLGFARHLPKFGWRSVVVAERTNPWEPVDELLGQQVPPDVRVYHAAYPRWRVILSLWQLLDLYAFWLPSGLLACRRAMLNHQIESVVTSGPTHWAHLLGLYLKLRYGLPWIADFRDPWIHHPLPGGAKGKGRRVVAWWEKKVIRYADAIVSNAPLVCKALQSAYPRYAHKMVTITNGFDPETFEALGRSRAERTEINIVHTGELYAGRDPRPFFDALQELQEARTLKRPIQVKFVGRVSECGINLEGEIRQRGLEKTVTLAGQVSYKQALNEMIDGTILLLLDSSGRRMGVPAKLYEYLGAARPILALVEPDSDAAWVLQQSGILHRIAPPGNPSAIKQALSNLIGDIDAGFHTQMPQESLSSFTREQVACQLANVLEKVRREQHGCHALRVSPTRKTPAMSQALAEE